MRRRLNVAFKEFCVKLEKVASHYDHSLQVDVPFVKSAFEASVNREMVSKLADMMGDQFNKYKGKGLDKKFISLLSEKMDGKDVKIKFALKEEMESSKFGIF